VKSDSVTPIGRALISIHNLTGAFSDDASFVGDIQGMFGYVLQAEKRKKRWFVVPEGVLGASHVLISFVISMCIKPGLGCAWAPSDIPGDDYVSAAISAALFICSFYES